MSTVVHILPYMAKGGTEKHVLTLARGLKDKYNLVLLAPRGDILEEFLKLGIIYREFPEIKGNILKKIKAFKKALLEINDKYHIDIIHIHAAHEFLIFTKKVLPYTPTIFHLSAHQGSAASKWINYKLSAIISRKKADYVIVVSEEEKIIVVDKGLPENKIKIIYNGYEISEGDDIDTIHSLTFNYNLQDCTVIGNLGRLHRTKRLDLLIKAFAHIKNKLSEKIKLLIIGDGPEKPKLKKLARRLNIEDDVTFTGFIKRGDRVLRIFDIFVLPTSFEGCSNVLVEAMAKKLPIITTDIPSVKWMFKDGESALLFKEGNLKDLEAKIIYLLKDRALRKKLSEGAFQRYNEAFKAEDMIRKVDELYKEILAKD